MSSKNADSSTAHENDPRADPQADSVGEIDIKTLLRDVRTALQSSPIGHFRPTRRRKNVALALQIDAYLEHLAPTPLGLAAVAAARDVESPPGVMVGGADTYEIATSAGVWLRARLLIHWEAILPHLPAFSNARYAAAIATLAPQERTVLLLHRMGGLSLGDIAKRLRCDPRACERLLAQALSNIARDSDGAKPEVVTD